MNRSYKFFSLNRMDTTLFLRVFSLNYFGERVIIIMMELLQLIVVIKNYKGNEVRRNIVEG